MKTLILAAIFLLSFTSGAAAQAAETFDLVTFQPPKGWSRQTGKDSVHFSIDNNGDYCALTLFRSLPGLGSPKENFNAAWATIVTGVVPVSAAPEMMPLEMRGEWAIMAGSSIFEKDGERGVALLYTASGYGRMMNALVLTNTQTYETTLTAFLSSIAFKKLEAPKQPAAPVRQDGYPLVTDNFWKMGGTRQGMLGHSGLSTATFSSTYQFLPDGTYKFARVNMQLAAPKYYLEHEEGTYKIVGNTITITSKKASYSQHRLNKEDPPIRSGSIPLSSAQYRYEFWKNDGNWALLLSPLDGVETKRDGTFSFWRNGEAQRTYQYLSVNAKGELIR